MTYRPVKNRTLEMTPAAAPQLTAACRRQMMTTPV